MPDHALQPAQREIVGLFFSLPESQGFVLVGGAALLALGLTDRPTQDVDFFTSDAARVEAAGAALSVAAAVHGWATSLGRGSSTFQRMVLRRDDLEVAVDIAFDTAALRPIVDSELGLTFDPLEHAARKALAVFDRAEARDFVDLYLLSLLFTRHDILGLAAQLDLGFDLGAFEQALRSITRFTDSELPCGTDVAALVRSFADEWARLARDEEVDAAARRVTEKHRDALDRLGDLG